VIETAVCVCRAPTGCWADRDGLSQEWDASQDWRRGKKKPVAVLTFRERLPFSF
jgi:hypothetical protein